MNFLAKVNSEAELNREFKRLAHICHPDKGGNVELMQQLNDEYRAMKKYFNAHGHDFSELKVGDTVYVNGTECMVSHVSEYAFIAKAKMKNRTAVFDKKTGRAVGNRKFRASLY
ncbi:MAG TPA: hypothetical protein VKA27_10615 [Sunxiuqinia sp.]|nr:hypothetical protein [Sunxiuqinia sp.]